MKKSKNIVGIYIISKICDLDEFIQKKYTEKFGEEEGKGKYSTAKSFYTLFLRAKINTETTKLGKDLERKEIDRRENHWEYLCNLLKEHFGEEESQEVKKAFSDMAEREVQQHILFETKNPFRKMQTTKVLQKEIEENTL